MVNSSEEESTRPKRELSIDISIDESCEINYNNNKVWSSKYLGVMNLYFYCISKYLNDNCQDKLLLKEEKVKAFPLVNGETYNILTRGIIVYSIDNILISYTADGSYVKIQSEKNIDKIINNIDNFIKYKNPYIGNNFNVIGTYEESELSILNINKTEYKDVIIEDDIKENIIDNTIFHLKNLSGSNGIIIYGAPGVGKSKICSALANDANNNKITTITLTSTPDFNFITSIINEFFTKCLLFMEDLDGIGESRINGNTNNKISELLQFINGIGSLKGDIVIIATTNYIELLDTAIKNRPVRFNRIIELKLPTKQLLKKIFEYYFDDNTLENIYLHYCNKNDKLKLTGAHVAEILRTSNLLSKKRGLNIKDVLDESINIVINSFNTTIDKYVGFNDRINN